MDALIPPIYQCKEGHALCNDCHDKITVCPACRDTSINIRCRVLVSVAGCIEEVSQICS